MSDEAWLDGFDLVKPPSLAGLSEERRSVLRRAIGSETIDRARVLVGAWQQNETSAAELIALDENGLLEDLKHDWIAKPIADLLASVVTIVALDLSNDTVAGQQLRRAAVLLVERAEAVAELTVFLDMFRHSIVHMLLRPACADGLALACALVEWMTAAEDDVSADRGAVFGALAEGFDEHVTILKALPWASQIVERSADAAQNAAQEMELLVGVPFPSDAPRWTDVCAGLERDGHDLIHLGSRQLRYLGNYEPDEDDWLSRENYFELALRMGRSSYPMLAHRAAYLTRRLIDEAASQDTERVASLFPTFYDAESIWMIDAQDDYEEARKRYLGGDPAAIIEAYGVMAEGTLRRYSSLVLAFERVGNNQPVQNPLVLLTMGDVETQLGILSHRPLASLILRFLERKLRNADAHANVVVGVDGHLKVRLRDGSVESLVPNRVYGKTAGLRSVLDGIDIAANIAWGQEKQANPIDWSVAERPAMSEQILGRLVSEFAQRVTPGYVTDVKVRAGVLTMTYHGEASYDQLLECVNSLSRLLSPERPIVRILSPEGALLQEFRPLRA